MSKLLGIALAAGLGLGLSTAIAQNVDSDKAKAQGGEKVMKEKENGTTGTSQDQTASQDQTGQASGERAKSDDSRSAPKPSEPDYTGGKPKQ